ncbi:hypothetical protein DFA_00290 [Cavenderia fasciculata]|uniref:Ankyrin repeat-containing protein n=1 Tax=Cavenderia fasciculata TaxID=261658 RepID=F4PY52_CACFS|nr:uncharacterized protein DFA_00290 [Cavenderia fasciculata]EGG19712.1 hypothetical protein DFA_00290 [Cavenderia fasciculata]|eukprot:XP_004358006.1 hypothetical protein DFA_00290 [Cavenderia fasciculata]
MTTTTTTTFQSLIKVKYIRDLIFNLINDISNQLLYRPDSLNDASERKGIPLKGRDIIKLPRLEMISIYAMPWNFLRHYLDIDQIGVGRRRLAITQYCHHPNATLDTLEHLVEWSTGFEFKWNYLSNTQLVKVTRRNRFNQEILEYLVKRCPAAAAAGKSTRGFIDNALEVAFENGYLSTVKLIHHSTKGVKFNDKHVYLACQGSHIELLKYLHDNRLINGKQCKDAMDEAAKNSLDIVKFLHFNRSEGCTNKAMDNAACNGHLDIVKFLHENRSEGCTTNAIDNASMNGHLEIVKYLQEHRSEGATTRAMDLAAKGHLEIVKYLQEHRSEGATTRAMDLAASSGHFEIVKYLHEYRSEGCTTNAIDNASMNGHLEIVKYLYEQRTEGATTNAMDLAAKGHLNVVKYLYENQTTTTTTISMEDGVILNASIEMLSYLVNTVKAKCTPDALRAALSYGKLDIFYFLHDHFSDDSCVWSPIIMDWAAHYGHIDVVKYLNEHRTEGATTRAMDWAASSGHFEIVKYLHEHRSEGATSNAMDEAAMRGYIDIVKFLHFNRTEGCTQTAIENACKYGRLETAEFLINVRKEKCNEKSLSRFLLYNHYDIVKLILPLFVDIPTAIQSIEIAIKRLKYQKRWSREPTTKKSSHESYRPVQVTNKKTIIIKQRNKINESMCDSNSSTISSPLSPSSTCSSSTTIPTKEEEEDRRRCYLQFGNIPNRICLKIVNLLENDIDLVCLLLTCKQFYYGFRQLYANSLYFKSIDYVQQPLFDDIVYDYTRFSMTAFYMRSFKSIFYNSLGGQLVYTRDTTDPIYLNQNQMNQSGEQQIETVGISRCSSNITPESIPQSTKYLYFEDSSAVNVDARWIPSQVKTLCLESQQMSSGGGGGGIVLPDSLKRLVMCLQDLPNVSLPKSLAKLTLTNRTNQDTPITLDYCFKDLTELVKLTIFGVHFNTSLTPPVNWRLPSALTTLNISLDDAPPFEFPPSLVTLYLTLENTTACTLSLGYLSMLKTLDIRSILSMPVSVSVYPPNLVSFSLQATSPTPLTPFPSTMTKLDTLYCNVRDLNGLASSSLPETLTDISLVEIGECFRTGILPLSTTTLLLSFEEYFRVMEGSIPNNFLDTRVTHHLTRTKLDTDRDRRHTSPLTQIKGRSLARQFDNGSILMLEKNSLFGGFINGNSDKSTFNISILLCPFYIEQQQ